MPGITASKPAPKTETQKGPSGMPREGHLTVWEAGRLHTQG